jgi:membrane protease YdiL (CAAX protease family)
VSGWDWTIVALCVAIMVATIALPAAAVYYLGGLDAWCALAGVVIFWAALIRAGWLGERKL